MGVAPGDPPLLHLLNDRAVLSAVLDDGPSTEADLMARTGLTASTVQDSVRRLMAHELLAGELLTGSLQAGGLVPVRHLGGAEVGVAVGMEVRSGRICAVAVDAHGVETHRLRRRRATEIGAPAQIVGILAELKLSAPVRALVIGVPGAYDRTDDRLRYADRMTGWRGEGLVHAIRQELPGVEVEVENDAKLVAIAEHTVGVGRGTAGLALLYSGSGLASAAVVDGVLHRGATGAAGEIGYLTGIAGPGSVQDRLGPQAVLELGREHGLHHGVAVDLVAAVARADSGAAVAVLDELARRYAAVVTMIVLTLDPQRLVLTGPLLQAGGESLRYRIASLVTEALHRRVDLRLAEVPDPVLTGAVLRAAASRRLRALEQIGAAEREAAWR